MKQKTKSYRRKHHIFYKTTCLVTGKYYYGMHSTDNIDDGYLGSGKKLKYSILKHGPDNHQYEIIKSFPTRAELRDYEESFVNEKLLKDPLCMNLIRGGNASYDPDKTFVSLSENAKRVHTGRKAYHNPETGEHRKFFPNAVLPGFIPGGRKKSEKTRENMRKAQQKNASTLSSMTKGRMWFHNPGTGETLRLHASDAVPAGFIKGRGPHSEQSRDRRSTTMKTLMSSPEAKLMLSQRFKGRIWCYDPSTMEETLIAGPDAPTGLRLGRAPRNEHRNATVNVEGI